VTDPRVAVVVPTLGQRPRFLPACLRSLRDAGAGLVVLVAPASFDASALIAEGLVDTKLDETGRSLPAAIDQGFASLPPEVEYIAWLGDDDLLRPDAIRIAAAYLDGHPRSSAVYGRCDYIDEDGRVVWSNRSGPWAVPLLRFGPNLIPQPGSLFRRSSYERTPPLREDLGWAFDMELFIQLSKVGRVSYLPRTLAAFRWHADSLTVGQRRESVAQASSIRREHLPAWMRPISIVWEGPVRWATFRASALVKEDTK
jgi:hypothetical protein